MRQFFTENNNRLSMKRLCGLICTLSLCIKLIHTPTDALVYSVAFMGGGFLGLTTAEKIFKNYKNERSDNTGEDTTAASKT